MPIVSSQVLRRINKPNAVSVYELHTDHTGKVHDYRYRTTNVGQDDTLLLPAHAAELEANLIENEKLEVENQCLNGVDPFTITVDHITEADRVRACMRAFVTGDADVISHMLAWVQSFSTPDLNGLGFTSEERGQISAREGSITGVKDLLETDQLFQLEEF